MMLKAFFKNSMLLASLALISVSLIVFTHQKIQPFVEANKQKTFEKNLLKLLPPHTHNNKLLEDKVLLSAGTLSNRTAEYAYFAFINDEPKTVILPVTALNGFNGDIQLMVAIDFDGNIIAVRVLSHHETQGLGDAIEIKKSNWILGFNNLGLENTEHAQWALKQESGVFDQISGATITSRAVVNAVYKSLVYFEQHQHHLLIQREQEKL